MCVLGVFNSIDALEYQTVEVNVEICRRTEALNQRNGAGVDFIAFETGLFCEMTGDGTLYTLQHRREQLGRRGQQHAQRDRQ